MKLCGALLLTASGLAAGLYAARQGYIRLSLCRSLCQMLRLISFQLERFLTPLPELFSALAGQVPGGAGTLCAAVAAKLENPGESFSDIWSRALEALPGEEREILLPLGQVLGRYAAAEQIAAVTAALRDMTALADTLGGQLREKSRVYIGLATAGGAMLAVLLL